MARSSWRASRPASSRSRLTLPAGRVRAFRRVSPRTSGRLARASIQRAGHRLDGIVVDEGGHPLNRVRIAAVPRAVDADALLYGRQFAWTDARGHFAFDNLPGDESRILATTRNRPTVLTKVNAETQDDVRIVLPEAATLVVRLRAPGPGKALDGASVVMITGHSDDMQERGPLGILSGVTGTDGTVAFEAAPGHVKMAMFTHDT